MHRLRAGHPIGLLVELVNHVASRRGGVPAGTFVTTGTHTGLVFTWSRARGSARSMARSAGSR